MTMLFVSALLVSVPVYAENMGQQTVQTVASEENEEGTIEMSSYLESYQETEQNYEIYYVISSESSATFYAQPDESSEVICLISYGEAVSYIEPAENGFCKIIYGGGPGYVLESCLSTEKASEIYYESLGVAYTLMYPTYYVLNCKQSITLRSEPSIDANEICQIPLGAAVSFVEPAENGFYKIIYNDVTGYGLADYISVYRTSKNFDTDSSVYYPTYYVVNCEQTVTLRTDPDSSSGEICQVPAGATVAYLGTTSNGFDYISYQGNDGYILSKYLVIDPNGYDYDVYRIVNCNESISLYFDPDMNAEEICQVPIDAYVRCAGMTENGFGEVYYMGNHGYVLDDYLEIQ